MTLTELKLAALRKLKVISAGEDARARDFELMGERYTSLHAMLLDKEMVRWGVTEDIPAKYEMPIIALLCALSVDDFGVPEPRASTLKLEGLLDLSPPSVAEKQLLNLLSDNYITSRLRAEYF